MRSKKLQAYLEVELETKTMRQVELLARKSGVVPLEVCAILLSERISHPLNAQARPKSASAQTRIC